MNDNETDTRHHPQARVQLHRLPTAAATGRVENRTRMENDGNQKNNTALPRQPQAARQQRPVRITNNNINNEEASSEEAGEEAEEEEFLARKYGAEHVIKLFVPVGICMLLVVLVVKTVEYYSRRDGFLIYTPFQERTDSDLTKLWMSVANMFIFIAVVAAMTFVLFLLFKYRCYRFIHGWLVFTSVTVLFMFLFVFIAEILDAYYATVDYITLAIVLWNIGVVGVICIHWSGPLLLQQAYLILVSVLMALIFIKFLPDWTTWTILAGICVWDLVAVLTTCGPLRKLVELAQQRNESIFPSLIYTSGVVYMMTTINNNNNSETNNSATDAAANQTPVEARNLNSPALRQQQQQSSRTATATTVTQYSNAAAAAGSEAANNESRQRRRPDDNVRSGRRRESSSAADADADRAAAALEDEGIKLGLGDFIFYSVLVGKASSQSDLTTVIACYFAILIGLCLTLVLLAIHQRALPALPISLSLGLVFFFLTSLVMKPFLDELSINQVFV